MTTSRYTAISFHDDWRRQQLTQREVSVSDPDKARQIAQAQILGGAVYAQVRSSGGEIERVRLNEEREA